MPDDYLLFSVEDRVESDLALTLPLRSSEEELREKREKCFYSIKARAKRSIVL